MKKTDKLATLLDTLPRIIGVNVDDMVLFLGSKKLDPNQTLLYNELSHNDTIRMMPKEKVDSYLRRIQRRALVNSTKSAASESTNVI